MSVAVIIVAAGRGARAGEGLPKQYRAVAGEPVLARAMRPFLAHPAVDAVLPVIHPADRSLYERASAPLHAAGPRLLAAVPGGSSRQASVLNGLEALGPRSPEIVLIHDAARPFVAPDLIGRAIEAGRRAGAAVPGVPVTDTIKLVDENDRVVATPDRARLRAVQTPQAFHYASLLRAHRQAAEAALDGFTDDAALAEWAKLSVEVFEGDSGNVKLTHPADFEAAERRLGGGRTYRTRFATGFDVHAFAEGDHVWLGGVRVPHTRGVLAHSDGDVILHALTDALLGAIAEGDIGVHFPPSDPRWRGASSDRFLAHAAGRVRERGGVIDHLDVTLLCEAPKIGPHRDAIRARIAEIAGIAPDQVSVKATTTEKLGFTGRGEGLAAQAAATVRLPEQPHEP
ncbi:MAG TPA: bifunctional 2-C-methyl-D-erythritol 4-phosphate cytidylyltransferase/2-C-methyl-D-erythritol 2,4-cyclodiphosphate synthase [Microvirga sp.]|nr:bifunctional 2-C-methyl-D-erythritol 4-phosphate cytidylyltransferase/2-C-methyl-D-erythritol 2,4-cyclodiphosphate synthase [Microvirga sp.]